MYSCDSLLEASDEVLEADDVLDEYGMACHGGVVDVSTGVN